MISIYEVLLILLVHYIADFIFQDDYWAKNKNKDNICLIKHTSVYSLVTFMLLLPVVLIYHPDSNISIIIFKTMIFSVISFVFHTVTDYYTSRIVGIKFENKQYGTKIPSVGVFSVIGLDQLLHYIQLFLMYKYLFL